MADTGAGQDLALLPGDEGLRMGGWRGVGCEARGRVVARAVLRRGAVGVRARRRSWCEAQRARGPRGGGVGGVARAGEARGMGRRARGVVRVRGPVAVSK